jgi:FkbM family methyltransferase
MINKSLFGIETTAVQFDGAEYFVPGYAHHRPVCRKILTGEYAEPDLHAFVERLMARGGSMIHAGTFFGDMLPAFSRKTPSRLIAFEPAIENYLLAHATVEANALDNVMLVHAGLGRQAGTMLLETSGVDGTHRGGSSRLFEDEDHQFVRPQRTTVLAIDQFRVDDLVLIQLDVEGFELEVLRGARRTLRTLEPVVVVEDLQRKCGPFLRRMGYEPQGRVSGNLVWATPARAEEHQLAVA